MGLLARTIQELRQTSGNTETSTGNIQSGVTAASAIAALQEASGKGSRDASRASYRCFQNIVGLCIELIRQFYDLPRQFRILGPMGREKFVSYSNQGLLPVTQGAEFGTELGFRLPVFDIRVSAQKRNLFATVSQNELALQLFKLGMFDPAKAEAAVMCLGLMEFEGKDGIMQALARKGGEQKQLSGYMELAAMLARKAAPHMEEGIRREMGKMHI